MRLVSWLPRLPSERCAETIRLDARFGSGPGVELHAPNGCCTSFTGYSKVEITGLEPATYGHPSVAEVGEMYVSMCLDR